ncbi:unnamed protein product [Timema podura]|uniref:Uncharacterized protein n=1 Tax=Timema podura TaxID=61482 RepID=A0ABN7NGM8_TIMPD|nr:unnamed protein product [Timema podura]
MEEVFSANPKRCLSMPVLHRALSTDLTPLKTRSDPSVQYSIFKKRSDSFHPHIAPFLPDPPCLCPCVCVSKYLQMSDMDAIAGGAHNKQETLTYFASKFAQFENCDISELLLELLYEGLRPSRYTAKPPEYDGTTEHPTAHYDLLGSGTKVLRPLLEPQTSKEKASKLSPGRASHQAHHLIITMASYYTSLPVGAQQILLHRINLLYIELF